MAESLTMHNTVLQHKIRCKWSGLVIGELSVKTTAGVIPYLSYWDKCVAYHPVFSMEHGKLLKFTKDEWTRLAQRATDHEVSQDESDILCVSYLAVLHTLDAVKQDYACLPPLAVVHSTIAKLFNLAFWKWKLESERFRFPTLHISRHNHNDDFSNIGHYLDTCFDIRKDYESNVREAVEKEKVRAAERAIIALNSQWVTPTSKKLLWQWVKAHLPSQYHPDAEGWLSTLFLGGSAAIVDFDEDDINLAEQIITSSCPNGTGVMFAVRQRLEVIKKVWEQHNAAFSIDLADYADGANLYVNGEKVTAPDPGLEPQKQDFSKMAHYYVAHAKWQIATAAFKKDNKGLT